MDAGEQKNADDGSPTGNPIAILEKPGDVAVFLDLPVISRGPARAIATTPGVCWELEKRHQPYRILEDYLSAEEVYRIGRENFRRVDRVCSLLDESLSSQIDTFRGVLKPGSDNYLFMKMVYDALSIRVHLLREIIGREQADHVITVAGSEGSGPPPRNYVTPFSEDNPVFSALLDLEGWPCRHERVRAADHPPSSRPLGPAAGKGGLRTLLKNWSLALDIFTTAKIHGPGAAIGFAAGYVKNQFQRPRYLYIATYSPGWNALLPRLNKRGYTTVHLETMYGTPRGSGKSPGFSFPSSRLAELCTVGSIDFSPLFLERLRHLYQAYGEVAPLLARDLTELFRSKKPEALLFGTRSNFMEQIPAHIAKEFGIPVISYQHGAGGYFEQPILLYDELMNSDFQFAWGPSVRDQMMGEELNRFPCRICPVGSMELESIHQDSLSHTRSDYALYVTSMYYLSRFYVGYRYPPRDNLLWMVQRRILRCLADHRITTIFKLHPSSYQEKHLREYLEDPAFRTITAVRGERQFTGLLPDAGFIVIDLPSTVLIQAVATRKPMFVLLLFLQLTDEAEELLRKRAFCYRSLGELLAALEGYLEGKALDQRPDVNNTEFLERYGITSSVDTVEDRALATLERILKAKPRSSPG